MLERSIPALMFINPSLCSTITTFLSVDRILLDSFIIACINPASLFKSIANFLASSDTSILFKSKYLFSALETIL